MSKFISEKTIKEMIKASKQIMGSKVLIAGFTFKENCPDVRFTKIIEIYNELYEYGVDIDIFDPVADAEEAYKEYGVNIISDLPEGKYDAIILAVKHDVFYKYFSIDKLHDLFNKEGVLIDVKWMFEEQDMKEKIRYWRL